MAREACPAAYGISGGWLAWATTSAALEGKDGLPGGVRGYGPGLLIGGVAGRHHTDSSIGLFRLTPE